MESYLAIVLTNKDKSIDDVMKPFGIKQKIAKYIDKTKSDIILEENSKLIEIISEYSRILDQFDLDGSEKSKKTRAYNYLNKIYNSSDEEIFKFVIRDLDKSMFDKDGNMYSNFNKYARWLDYKTDSLKTKILPVKSNDIKKGYILTNKAKLKDILWDKLKYKGLFPDATVTPEGIWFDTDTRYYLKVIKDDKGEITFEDGIVRKCVVENDPEWMINIVEYFY